MILISNDFWHKRKMDNFYPYNVLLSIATNIPVLLMTASVLQGHIYPLEHASAEISEIKMNPVVTFSMKSIAESRQVFSINCFLRGHICSGVFSSGCVGRSLTKSILVTENMSKAFCIITVISTDDSSDG